MTAGLLAWVMRSHTRIRYRLWFVASVKFLIPLSLLAVMGSHLASLGSTDGTNARFYITMVEVSQPFKPLPLTRRSASKLGLLPRGHNPL